MDRSYYSYWTTACRTCALKAQCTTGQERRIGRWEHEPVLEQVQDRLDRDPARGLVAFSAALFEIF
jgi:hypothetical protein